MDIKSTLFKNKYRITSARLKDWDYSCDGMYSVTICARNRQLYFGDIKNQKMQLSKMGGIAYQYWNEIPKHFPDVTLDESIIMPNHVHGIIVMQNGNNCNNGRDAINRVSTGTGGVTNKHNPMLNPYSLSTIIRWFKGRTTYEINKTQINNHFRWQPRFYDQIIRNEESLRNIREYICNNPLKWEFDRDNPQQRRILNPVRQ